jgi:hypothetical protein
MLFFSAPPMRPARGNFIRADKILRLFVEPVAPKRDTSSNNNRVSANANLATLLCFGAFNHLLT